LPFAHTTDCATKTDADVGWHGLSLSPGASHTTTADESHISETVFAIPESKLDLANVANHYVQWNERLFGFRNRSTPADAICGFRVYCAAVRKLDHAETEYARATFKHNGEHSYEEIERTKTRR
jgi:aromatic ring hydroxylase